MKGIGKGKKLSQDHKNKISESNKGKVVTQETRDKIKDKMINRIVTWGKKISEANKGKSYKKPKLNKKIIQRDKNGNILNEFNSITEAANTIKIKFNSISNVLNGRTKTSGGYIWEYKK